MVLLFSIFVNLNPKNLASLESVVRAGQLLEGGEFDEAYTLYLEILRSHPGRTDLYQNTGEAAFSSGDFDGAIRYLELAKNQNVIDSQGLLILGDAYFASAETNEAIKNWNLVELNQENAEDVSMRLVDMYVLHSDWDEAIDCLVDWNAVSPGDPRQKELIGWIYLFSNPQKSSTIFAQLNAETNQKFSDISIILMNFPNGEVDNQHLSLWWVEVGDAMHQHDEVSLALKAYEKSVDIEPENGYGWAKLAILKLKTGQKGDDEINRAIRTAGDQEGVYGYIADYFVFTNQSELAIIYLHKALDVDPTNPVILNKLGWLLSDMGNINDGINYINQAALSQNSGEGWKNVIIYCLNNGIYIKEKALPAARYAIALDPHSTEILDLAGEVFAALEDYATAEKYYVQSIKENGDNYLAHYHLGKLYIQIRENTKAYEHLVTAAEQSDNEKIREDAKILLSKMALE